MEILKNKSKNKLFLTAFLVLFFFCISLLFYSFFFLSRKGEDEIKPKISYQEMELLLEKKEKLESSNKGPHLQILSSPQKDIIFAIAAEDGLSLQALPGWNFSLVDTHPVWDPTLCAQMKSVVLPGGGVFMIDARYIPEEKGGKLGLVNQLLLYKEGVHYEVKINQESFKEKVLSLSQDEEGNPIIIYSLKNKVFSYAISFDKALVKRTILSFGEGVQKISLSQSQNFFYLKVEKGLEKRLFRFDGASIQSVLYSEFLDKIEISPSSLGFTLKNSSGKIVQIPAEESHGVKLIGELGDFAYIEIFDRLNPFYFKLGQVDFATESFVVLAETQRDSKAKHITIGSHPTRGR